MLHIIKQYLLTNGCFFIWNSEDTVFNGCNRIGISTFIVFQLKERVYFYFFFSFSFYFQISLREKKKRMTIAVNLAWSCFERHGNKNWDKYVVSIFDLTVGEDEKLYRFSCCNLWEKRERNLSVATAQKMVETVLTQWRMMFWVRVSILKVDICHVADSVWCKKLSTSCMGYLFPSEERTVKSVICMESLSYYKFKNQFIKPESQCLGTV